MDSLVRNLFHRNKLCCVSSVKVATYDNTTVYHGMTRCVAKTLEGSENLYTQSIYKLIVHVQLSYGI